MSKELNKVIEFLRNSLNLKEFDQETKKVVRFKTPKFHLVLAKNRKKITVYTESIAESLKFKYNLEKKYLKNTTANSNIKGGHSRLKNNTERCRFSFKTIKDLESFINNYNAL